jgi:hypothetical protein
VLRYGLASIAFIAACTSLDGLTSSDAPDAGDETTDATEAGAAGDDAAPEDAASDDARSDEDRGPDTAKDAGSDAREGGTWCQAQSPPPAFCADFDEGSLEKGWSGPPSASSGGKGSLDTHLFHSPPGSFAVDIPAHSGIASAYLSASVVQSFSEATLAFDVYATDYSHPIAATIALSAGGSAHAYYVELELDPTSGQIHEHDTTDRYTSFGNGLPTGQWARVAMTLKLPKAGAAGSLTVSYNGVVQLDHHPVSSATAFGSPKISLGAIYATSAWQGHFDDVALDLN